jgi:hypothetical protein
MKIGDDTEAWQAFYESLSCDEAGIMVKDKPHWLIIRHILVLANVKDINKEYEAFLDDLYQCDYCQEYFESSDDLDDNFYCEDCAYKLTDESKLTAEA